MDTFSPDGSVLISFSLNLTKVFSSCPLNFVKVNLLIVTNDIDEKQSVHYIVVYSVNTGGWRVLARLFWHCYKGYSLPPPSLHSPLHWPYTIVRQTTVGTMLKKKKKKKAMPFCTWKRDCFDCPTWEPQIMFLARPLTRNVWYLVVSLFLSLNLFLFKHSHLQN